MGPWSNISGALRVQACSQSKVFRRLCWVSVVSSLNTAQQVGLAERFTVEEEIQLRS